MQFALSLGRDAANALKRFLTGQFIKFFLLIGPSNISKHLYRDFDSPCEALQ